MFIKLKKRDKIKNTNSLAFTIIALSVAWCVILLLRTKSILGQKFLMISGSNIWNAKGVELSENVYLMLCFVGIAGTCYGLWTLYSSFVKLSATKNLSNSASPDNQNLKKYPMCRALYRTRKSEGFIGHLVIFLASFWGFRCLVSGFSLRILPFQTPDT